MKTFPLVSEEEILLLVAEISSHLVSQELQKFPLPNLLLYGNLILEDLLLVTVIVLGVSAELD